MRDNILFGRPYEEQRYHQTLEACALTQDLLQLPSGKQYRPSQTDNAEESSPMWYSACGVLIALTFCCMHQVTLPRSVNEASI